MSRNFILFLLILLIMICCFYAVEGREFSKLVGAATHVLSDPMMVVWRVTCSYRGVKALWMPPRGGLTIPVADETSLKILTHFGLNKTYGHANSFLSGDERLVATVLDGIDNLCASQVKNMEAVVIVVRRGLIAKGDDADSKKMEAILRDYFERTKGSIGTPCSLLSSGRWRLPQLERWLLLRWCCWTANRICSTLPHAVIVDLAGNGVCVSIQARCIVSRKSNVSRRIWQYCGSTARDGRHVQCRCVQCVGRRRCERRTHGAWSPVM
jgi:hypothetical protein